jgi:hypothetical protein
MVGVVLTDVQLPKAKTPIDGAPYSWTDRAKLVKIGNLGRRFGRLAYVGRNCRSATANGMEKEKDNVGLRGN